MQQTPILDKVKLPSDLRALPEEQLQKLADELRVETIRQVAGTGGHLGAGLGVVELTVALHYIFDTPNDRLIWDVGHQAYPHKIITGRRAEMNSIRQYGGLSGFTKRAESEYDVFGAGHSSTSISAALGMAVGSSLVEQQREAIAVIGDGALSAGMAYEAINNAGALGQRLIVVLNDNDMSIAPPVGAMSSYLAQIISSSKYRSIRHIAAQIARKFPEPMAKAARKFEHYARGMASSENDGGGFFESLGFYYIGPIDGHNLEHMLAVLKNIKQQPNSGPILLHVVTKKGYGYAPAEASDDKYHGVAKFDIVTGKQKKSKSSAPSYTSVFANKLINLAQHDEKIVAITAAMPGGTGIDKFEQEFPKRTFDVGIAEQHAVTFAGGLAIEGLRPFVTIYSTFLQRAYDQIIHDIAIQNLPVRFAIDRAGLVGADGATHAGSFDIAYLSTLPNMVLMAASCDIELEDMVELAAQIDDAPSAFRYPRGAAVEMESLQKLVANHNFASRPALEIGKGWVVCDGSDGVIISYGDRLYNCLDAAQMARQEYGLEIMVVDMRFAKPMDMGLLADLTSYQPFMLTVESGAAGGFAAHMLQNMAMAGILNGYSGKINTICLPDYFMGQGSQDELYEEAGLSSKHILQEITRLNGIADSNRFIVNA